MLASLIDIAKTDKIQSSDVSDLINSMLEAAGLKNKSSLSYQDFQVEIYSCTVKSLRIIFISKVDP